MVTIDINPTAVGQKWPPQIVLLLDDEARVLNVNRSLAGSSFSSISEVEQQRVHHQLHPHCDGQCRFKELWTTAWACLETRESIEWEVNDTQLKSLLRLNLSKLPTSKKVEQERRQRHPMLIITDITKYRREYESVIEREQTLVKLLLEQGARLADSGEKVFDEAGDTGIRLMAGYIKKDRSFNRHMILVQENERKRIASELHDGIAQTIGAVKYKIEAGVASLQLQHPDVDVSVFDDTIDQIKGAVDEVRRISSNLAPSMLEDFGLCVALDWLCKEFGSHHTGLDIHCELCIDEGDTPNLVKIAIYRVVQQALDNVSRHSSATRVDVSLQSTGEGVSLTIGDNGTGFDLLELQHRSAGRSGFGFGLPSMRERVEATGGTFDIESEPGQGVVIRAEWLEAELGLIE